MTADTALIESIVQEVVARFQVLSHQKTILVLGRETDVDPARLEEYFQNTSRFMYLEQITENVADVTTKGYEKVIVPCLSCSDMADLAIGKASGGVATIILSLLLNGQCVEVLDFEYHGFVNSIPSNLWALYESYEKTLVGFGLSSCASVSCRSVVLSKCLITEQDVTDMLAAGAESVTVAHGAIITPLALDIAKTHKLQIIKK